MTHLLVAQHRNELRLLVEKAIERHGPACDLNHIDVSNIDWFEGVFQDLVFHGDISDWNMSKATSTRSMFANCPFNGDLSKWDMHNVQTMNKMFEGSGFNGNIAAWDTRRVKDTQDMFKRSPFAQDLSTWRFPSLLHANNMFVGTPFNSDVSAWNPALLRTANRMFDTRFFHASLEHWTFSQHCACHNIVHDQYTGVLPMIQHNRRANMYESFLGSHPNSLERYLKNVPFNRVHADVLLENASLCLWTRPETVRWARNQIRTGRSIGLNEGEISTWLVQQYAARHAQPLEIDMSAFNVP